MSDLLRQVDDLLEKMYLEDMYLDPNKVSNNADYQKAYAEFESVSKLFEIELSEKNKKLFHELIDKLEQANVIYGKEIYRQAYLMGNMSNLPRLDNNVLKIESTNASDNKNMGLLDKMLEKMYYHDIFLTNESLVDNPAYQEADKNFSNLRKSFEETLSMEQTAELEHLLNSMDESQDILMVELYKKSVLVGLELMSGVVANMQNNRKK
ncbi:MAG: hypothetical protein HFF02_07900 [Erysipelotrichaceae bacterium]|nr:hypothetical protein [Erysipelotrichaceae bacterium]